MMFNVYKKQNILCNVISDLAEFLKYVPTLDGILKWIPNFANYMNNCKYVKV